MSAGEIHAQTYTAGAEEYARVLDPWLAPMLTRLVDVADVRRGDRVLDVATGTGAAARIAAAAGAEAAAVDISPGMVELARRISPATIRFEVADAAALPFGDRSFERVLCGFGLSHLPDVAAALAEIRRVLVPGGLLAACAWGAGGRSAAPPFAGSALGGVIDEAAWEDAERSASVLRAAAFDPVHVRTETFTGRHRDADAAVAWRLAWPGIRVAFDALEPEAQAAWLEGARGSIGDLSWSFPVNYYTAVSA